MSARTGLNRPSTIAVSTTARASGTTRTSGRFGSSAEVRLAASGGLTLRIQACPTRRLSPRVVNTRTSGLGGARVPRPASRTASQPLSAEFGPPAARPAKAQSARVGGSGRVSTTPRVSRRHRPRRSSVRIRARLMPHVPASAIVSTRGMSTGCTPPACKPRDARATGSTDLWIENCLVDSASGQKMITELWSLFDQKSVIISENGGWDPQERHRQRRRSARNWRSTSFSVSSNASS